MLSAVTPSNKSTSTPAEQTLLSQRALERRIKRYLKGQMQSFFAICPPAFTAVLQTELEQLGINDVEKLEGGIRYHAPLDSLYHTNLHVRSAHRILLRIKEDFLAQSYAMLFDHAKRLPWELYLGFAERVKISLSAKVSKLHYQQAFGETLHNAMLARLEPLGIRPCLDAAAPLHIVARLYQDRCTLSLDTTGTHLHKRGYRQHIGTAPLRETLAASLLLWLEANGVALADFGRIHDPFCGSGTLLIEADQLLRHYPAGVARAFAFENAPFFQASKWQRFKQEALHASQQVNLQMQVQTPHLEGSDNDANVLEAAQHNSTAAACNIAFSHEDALNYTYPATERCLILSNPPYGQRLLNNKGDKAAVQALLEQWLQGLPRGYHLALILPEKIAAALAPSDALTLAFRNGNLRVRACYWQHS